MIHQRERLAFGLKPGDDAFRVHARFDDFHGHPPAHRFFLFGHEDDATTAFPDLLEQFVSPHAIPGFLANGRPRFALGRRFVGRAFQKITDIIMALEESFDALAQFGVAAAHAIQIRGPFADGQLESFGEDLNVTIGRLVHWIAQIGPGVIPQNNRKPPAEL
jgi:hypothetical protein